MTPKEILSNYVPISLAQTIPIAQLKPQLEQFTDYDMMMSIFMLPDPELELEGILRYSKDTIIRFNELTQGQVDQTELTARNLRLPHNTISGK